MRWPKDAVSLVGRAGALSPGKTYTLMRAPLRKSALNYLGQLPQPRRITSIVQASAKKDQGFCARGGPYTNTGCKDQGFGEVGVLPKGTHAARRRRK